MPAPPPIRRVPQARSLCLGPGFAPFPRRTKYLRVYPEPRRVPHPSRSSAKGGLRRSDTSVPLFFSLRTAPGVPDTQCAWVLGLARSPPNEVLEGAPPFAFLSEGWALTLQRHTRSVPPLLCELCALCDLCVSLFSIPHVMYSGPPMIAPVLHTIHRTARALSLFHSCTFCFASLCRGSVTAPATDLANHRRDFCRRLAFFSARSSSLRTIVRARRSRVASCFTSVTNRTI